MLRKLREMWRRLVSPGFGSEAGLSRIDARVQQLKQRIQQLRHEHQYEDALSTATTLRGLVRKHFGDANPEYVWALRNLAYLRQQLGDYAAAKRHTRKRTKPHGRHSEQRMRSVVLCDLGVLYHLANNYEKAERRLQSGAGVLRSALGPEHPEVTSSERKIADLQQAQAASEVRLSDHFDEEARRLTRKATKLY